MVKRFVSIAAVLALFSTVALAQEGQVSGTIAGPDIATAQVGPGGGFMRGPGPMSIQGPQTRIIEMRAWGPMQRGPMMWIHRRGMHQWWSNPALAQKIGLTDQQKQQLEKISLAGQLKMIDLRADLEKQQVILGPMLQTYHPDEAQVLAQVEKVSQARAALAKEGVQNLLATRNVLTEEQWNKMKDFRMDFHKSFRRHGSLRSWGPPIPPTPSSK